MRRVGDQKGFIMPTVIILMVLMSTVAYAALVQTNNSLNLAYKQAYIQMARIASKAAVDYAQEQFDNASCGNYTGTAEQDIVNNSRYRVTFKSEVTATSEDGYAKTIKGTGSVYLPRLSSTAQYVFDIRSEIVRTYAVCKTPDNFAPLLWLDASETTSLKTIDTDTTTVTSSTVFGSAGNSSRDTIEERLDNGSQTSGSWQSNDLEMHDCDSGEFTNTICSSTSTRRLYTGLVFQNINVPKNAVISAATIEFSGGSPAGSGGGVTHSISGIYKSAANPHPDLFTQSTSNQVRTPMSTASLHTAAAASVTTNNFPPGNTTAFNVTNVVQEIISNNNWDPSANNGRIGFGLFRTSGNGSRRAQKNGVRLTVTYATTSLQQADNNESIGQWDDKSANQYHAKFAHGTAPIRVNNQINAKPVVRFNNGNLLSTMLAALEGKRELTVLAVLKSNFATSASDGRAVSGMASAGTNDTSGSTSIVPLLRNGSNSGFSSLYSGNSTSYRTNFTCGSTCASTPYLYTSLFQVNDTDSTITAILKGNGASAAQKTGISPPANPTPYTFGIDQLYIGGRRNGAMPGSGTDYFNGDFAEVIVYDKALECRQVEALEEYLRSKWNVTASQAATSCPEDTVPVL